MSAKEKAESIPAAFTPVPSGAFQKLRRMRGDWLSCNSERGQSVASFCRKSFRASPHAHVRTIELVPIGPFPPAAGGEAEAGAPDLAALERYTAAFFQCECRVGRPMKVGDGAVHSRIGDEGQQQLHVGSLIEVLGRIKYERDVLCRVGVTMCDLFDHEEGGFVYGTARPMDGVGVFSFARFGPDAELDDGSGAGPASGPGESAHRRSPLYRCAKVLTHELGHLFGIEHCIHFECLMCGCNHLQEFDQRPLHLCPIDLRKLHEGCRFDVRARYAALAELYGEFGWPAEREWCQTRIAHLASTDGPRA